MEKDLKAFSHAPGERLLEQNPPCKYGTDKVKRSVLEIGGQRTIKLLS